MDVSIDDVIALVAAMKPFSGSLCWRARLHLLFRRHKMIDVAVA